jgi:hypothetical protein
MNTGVQMSKLQSNSNVFLYLNLCLSIPWIILLLAFQRAWSGSPLNLHDVTLKNTTHTFLLDPKFHNYDTNSARYWRETIPENDGFIKFWNSDRTRVWKGVTMFHELHCLVALRLEFQLILNEKEKISELLQDGDKPHIAHCFDYLRQVCSQSCLYKLGFLHTRGLIRRYFVPATRQPNVFLQ